MKSYKPSVIVCICGHGFPHHPDGKACSHPSVSWKRRDCGCNSFQLSKAIIKDGWYSAEEIYNNAELLKLIDMMIMK